MAAKKTTTKKATAKKVVAKRPAKQAAAKKSTSAAKKSVGKNASKTKGAKAAGKKTPSKTQAKKAATKKSVSKKQASTKKATKKVAKKASAGSVEVRGIPASAKFLRDQKWLSGQREKLLEERAKYTSSADRLAAEAAALMADREPGDVQFDEESGEGDTIAVERDRDLALSAAARQAVDDIDSALARLDANTYGLCVAGDDVIPKERLEAIPEAAVCVQHKTSMF